MRKWVISAIDLKWLFDNVSEEIISKMTEDEIDELLEAILEEESEVYDYE